MFRGDFSQFVGWFDSLTTGQQTIFALVVTLAAPIAAWLLKQLASFSYLLLRRRQGPELVLLAPSEALLVRWVPGESLGMNWWKEGLQPDDANRGDVAFGLKNLGQQAVTEIVMDWTIRSQIGIKDFFLSAESFQPFTPSLNGNFVTLSKPPAPGQSHALGIPAMDHRRIEIPYCRPTPTTDEAEILRWPAALDHSFLLRIVAGGFAVFTGHYLERGPTIDVAVQYSDSNGRYRRRFAVDSEVTRFPDNASGTLCGPDIASANQSPHNFRGRVRFIVRRVK